MIYLYFYTISLSLVGYGFFISKFLKIESKCIGLNGIIGLTLLTLISYTSSLFVNHGHGFNSIILFIGCLLLVVKILNEKKLISQFFLFFLIFSLLVIFILLAKNHDDFGYYHFSYTNLLVEYSHPLGLGSWNNGFRSPSSLFFISSMFYLPGIDIYLFHITPALILGFTNIVLVKLIFDKENFKNSKFINFLSLIIFCFINIFFYRLAEHGTDRSGMILVLLTIIYILNLINVKPDFITAEKQKDLIKIICIILCFVPTIKPFFLINLLFISIIFFHKDYKKLFKKLIFSKTFFYCISFLFFTIFYTFVNSGCLVFPVPFLCFENFSWSVDKSQVNDVKIWFELWSKAGATPNYIVQDRIHYISYLNWLPNWINEYFFNKVSDFLSGIIFLSIFTILIFYKKNKIKNTIYNNYFSIYLILIIFCLEWFFNHPALRYGGYHLFALILFIPISSYLSKIFISEKIFFKKAILLISLTLIIFLGRNLSRLEKEFKLYNYNIFQNEKYKFIGGDRNTYYRHSFKMKKNLDHYERINFLGKELINVSKKIKK
jgi:hypothetical protein